MSYTDDTGNPDENVLLYIYKLKDHLYNLQLLWQGLHEDGKKKKIRVTDPVAPDDFIYLQISSLQVVLSPHNFVSQIKTSTEKNNLIMDTFTAFLRSILKEEFFNWNKFHMVVESYYNTLHLFLNTLEGGFGAQFTLGAQKGITTPIHQNKQEHEIKPYMDIPQMFGMDKSKPKKSVPEQHQHQQSQEDQYDYGEE